MACHSQTSPLSVDQVEWCQFAWSSVSNLDWVTDTRGSTPYFRTLAHRAGEVTPASRDVSSDLLYTFSRLSLWFATASLIVTKVVVAYSLLGAFKLCRILIIFSIVYESCSRNRHLRYRQCRVRKCWTFGWTCLVVIEVDNSRKVLCTISRTVKKQRYIVGNEVLHVMSLLKGAVLWVANSNGTEWWNNMRLRLLSQTMLRFAHKAPAVVRKDILAVFTVQRHHFKFTALFQVRLPSNHRANQHMWSIVAHIIWTRASMPESNLRY